MPHLARFACWPHCGARYSSQTGHSLSHWSTHSTAQLTSYSSTFKQFYAWKWVTPACLNSDSAACSDRQQLSSTLNRQVSSALELLPSIVLKRQQSLPKNNSLAQLKGLAPVCSNKELISSTTNWWPPRALASASYSMMLAVYPPSPVLLNFKQLCCPRCNRLCRIIIVAVAVIAVYIFIYSYNFCLCFLFWIAKTCTYVRTYICMYVVCVIRRYTNVVHCLSWLFWIFYVWAVSPGIFYSSSDCIGCVHTYILHIAACYFCGL